MINKKIAMSGMSIVAAMALMGGATFAFFTDQASSVGNTFSTGNANLSIAPDVTGNPGTYANSIPGANFGGMLPGDTKTFTFWLKNESSSPINLSLTSDLANLGGAYHGTDGSLPDKLMVSWLCDVDHNNSLGNDTPSTEYSIRDFVNGGNVATGTLAQNQQMICQMITRLSSSASNEVAGSEVIVDGMFDGTQTP